MTCRGAGSYLPVPDKLDACGSRRSWLARDQEYGIWDMRDYWPSPQNGARAGPGNINWERAIL